LGAPFPARFQTRHPACAVVTLQRHRRNDPSNFAFLTTHLNKPESKQIPVIATLARPRVNAGRRIICDSASKSQPLTERVQEPSDRPCFAASHAKWAGIHRPIRLYNSLTDQTLNAYGCPPTEIVPLPVRHVDAFDGAVTALEVERLRLRTAADHTLHIEVVRIAIGIDDR
jgi:hypothetical protein